MTYEIVNAKDSRIPSSAGNGTPFTLLACHDTEGGIGPVGAEGTISFLISTAAKRNASYHEIVSYEPSIRRFRVYVIVDGSRAAHSVAPQPISPTSGEPLYVPDAHVRAYLGVNVWNPNQGIYAQSIAGKVADVAAYAQDRYFRECMHRRHTELRTQFPTMKARAEHFRFNPRTRTDWGNVLMDALGGLVIPNALPKEADTMPNFSRPLYSIAVPLQVGASIRTAPRIAPETLAFYVPDVSESRRTIQPFAIAKGDEWTPNAGPLAGILSDEWYAYLIKSADAPAVVRYVHVGNRADAETDLLSGVTQMAERIASKNASLDAIAAEAAKGRNA